MDLPRPAGPSPTRVELFTHPICGGCREAIQALSPLAAAGEIELLQWSLAIRSGRERAAEAGVTQRRRRDRRRELTTRADLEAFLVILSSGESTDPPPTGERRARAPRRYAFGRQCRLLIATSRSVHRLSACSSQTGCACQAHTGNI
jgi:hypothetical protein